MNARQKAKSNDPVIVEVGCGEVVPIYATYMVFKDNTNPLRTKTETDLVEQEIRNMIHEKIDDMIEIRTMDDGDKFRITGGIKVVK